MYYAYGYSSEKVYFALKSVVTKLYDNEYPDDKVVNRYGYYSGFNYSRLIRTNRKPNPWSRPKSNLIMCSRGWHVILPEQILDRTRNWDSLSAIPVYQEGVNDYLLSGNEIWVVAVKGDHDIDGSKAVFGQIKFLGRIIHARGIEMLRLKAFYCRYTKIPWRQNPNYVLDKFNVFVEKVKANPSKYGLKAEDFDE
jgi:hypothetical protein